MTRFAVLLSGRGSNLRAILRHWQGADPGSYPSQSTPALVISNRPEAPGLAIARQAGLPATVVDHRLFDGRQSFEQAMLAELETAEVEWIVLAGFMRVLTAHFVSRFPGRILNTHPALLPAFPGPDGVGDALAAGVKVTGCTIHLVEEAVDAGPIVAQEAVPVLPGDDHDSLGARIRAVEHVLYPRVIAQVLGGAYRLDGSVVTLL